ncbi:MAG TPA: phosphonate ABC transporter, permease protein PhnE [Firmicutes bacterium]|nr:phosphonate ABC transporter, permease protein PhnE [Bacillota bacterium]
MHIKTPEYRWDAALNILLGLNRPVFEEIDGERVPVMREVNGETVPVMRRQGGLIRPDFSAKTLGVLVPDMLETIEIALLGTLIAVIIAFPLSFLAARNIVGSTPAGLAIYGIVRFLFNFLSAIPALVAALIFTVIVGVGPAAGVVALGFHSIGMVGRLFAEALEGVDRGPIEALQASGAGRIQTVVYAVVPQIGPLFTAYSIYRWDINVRMSMILGFVGAGGIGVFLQQNINLFNYTKVSSAFILILITVTLIDLGSSWLQRKIL